MDRIAPLLQPFVDQSVSIRSIVARGFQPPSGSNVRVVDSAAATDLLVIPAHLLFDTLQADRDFHFTAVAALWPSESPNATRDEAWRLQRILFDRGLVCIRWTPFAGYVAQCFLASDAVRALPAASRAEAFAGTPRGRVTVSALNEHGRFANQLFRYAYAKLYALRHGLSAEFPEWAGRSLFGLDDPPCADPPLPRLSFPGFSDEDLDLWRRDEPPVDVDLDGYFQETPGCWQHHRALLRSLFRLRAGHDRAVDAWHRDITDSGRRTLVAIHVRRGDYRRLQHELPWFCLVPEQWYLDWLRALWPTLVRPILFVATDEPDTIRPVFREFEMAVPPMSGQAALPAHVVDFEILRRADVLALCNSSFSRMASILAPSTQRCFIPSLAGQRFVAYQPWIDPAFWDRFRDAWRAPSPPTDPAHPVSGAGEPAASDPPAHAAHDNATAIHFDVSDLVLYLIDHATLSGIQRVQCEILRNVLAIPHRGPVRLVVLGNGTDFATIEASALLDILDAVVAGASSRTYVISGARGLLRRAARCTIQPREILVTIGAFWAVPGMGRQLQALKNRGVVIGTLIHDLLPIDAPEYFDRGTTRHFIKGVGEVLTFADFVFTTSEYNRASIARLMAARGIDGVPVSLVPLARELAHAPPAQPVVAERVQRIIESDYVLCVGTIEVRKNPSYLFHIWKMLLQSGRANIPALVFAGRSGWLVRDFLDQLAACNHLGGRIVMVHTATDVELDLLYRHCLLTMFPSFGEGWGLPVGESLAHGKICLCSNVGGIPEAGGAAADYIDPYNVRDGFDRLTRYLDDPALRAAREREIAGRFVARSWRAVAEDFLRATREVARKVAPAAGIAAIRLPAGQYLAIGTQGAAPDADALSGALSAEVSCISGWSPPDHAGAKAAEPEASLRFRADAPVGARIVVVFRLIAHGHAVRIRIRSGSGAETEVTVAVGTEHAAPLSCQVEADHLVTAQLSSAATAAWRRRSTDWSLAGFLYFEPGRLAAPPTGLAPSSGVATSPNGLAARSGGPAPASMRPGTRDSPSRDDRIALSPTVMDDSWRAPSLDAFVQSTDCWWASTSAIRLAEPLFADEADRRRFVSGRTKLEHAELERRDIVRLVRRSDVFVSTSRFSEGAIFDQSDVWRGMGFLHNAPGEHTPWRSLDPLRVDARALAAAPRLDGSFLVFYNGNLHNYYHWLAEGLVGLDVLTQAVASLPDVRIALPMSMDIAAVFDHRQTLHETGLADRPVIEVAEELVRVQEAIWFERDLIETMPAPHLKAFQRRIAARYADARAGKRRVLVARRGPTRTIANLAQVEAMLSEFGFETAYVEGMSMADQIRLFQGAEFIVSPHGAALANLLFCDPGTRVVELMPTFEFRPFFWIISAKLGLVHGLQFCPTVEHQGFVNFQGSLDVDVGKLRALVRNVSVASTAARS